MKRLFCLAAAAVLFATSACGPIDSGSLGPGPTGGPQPTGSTTPATPTGSPATESPNPSQDTITVQAWLIRNGKVFPTKRTRPHTVATSKLALTEVVAGPTTAESAVGVSTALAGGTAFTIVGITGGVATVDFPASFYAGGQDLARLRQAQVVFTLTQFPSVTRVGFQQGGQPQGWPLSRADYEDFLPRIVVLNPSIGQRVSSPITVSGTANAREATVNMRLLDTSGKEIATKFTTATCGSGCRGDYATAFSYKGCTEQKAVLEVYEVSGEDGSHQAVVSIPLTLAAC